MDIENKLISTLRGESAPTDREKEEEEIARKARERKALYDSRMQKEAGERGMYYDSSAEQGLEDAADPSDIPSPVGLAKGGAKLLLKKAAVGAGGVVAAKKGLKKMAEEMPASTREIMRRRWNGLSGEQRDAWKSFDDFAKEEIKNDKVLPAAARNAQEKLRNEVRVKPDITKEGPDLSSAYEKTRETMRPMEDIKKIQTPSSRYTSSAESTQVRTDKGPGVVRELDLEKLRYEGPTAQDEAAARLRKKLFEKEGR